MPYWRYYQSKWLVSDKNKWYRKPYSYFGDNAQNIALAKFVEEIKRNSSRWIKTKGEQYQNFAWQGGYAGYSVSQSVVEKVERYIENQKEHHKIISFQDEYRKFLDEYNVDYDENYLWV